MPRAVLRFRDGLLRRAGEARDHRQRPLGPGRRGLRRQFQHRPVQADIADRELRGVDADRKAAGAGVDVIARQRALMPGVERAVGVERQRMRRDHRAVGDQLPHLGFDLAMMHGDDSYPNSGPATANGSSAAMRGGAAEPHALKRPLDGPAGGGEALQEFVLRMRRRRSARARSRIGRWRRPAPAPASARSANSGPICRAVRPSRTSAMASPIRHDARAGRARRIPSAAGCGRSPWRWRSRAMKSSRLHGRQRRRRVGVCRTLSSRSRRNCSVGVKPSGP